MGGPYRSLKIQKMLAILLSIPSSPFRPTWST